MRGGCSKKKLVVYTAIFGDYDDLIEPKEKYKDCDFICFTDQKNLVSNIWEIRYVEKCDLPPHMMNRKYKILPHLFLSEYEWSLYVDGNVAILGNPMELANKYLSKYDLVVPKHFARNCIYEEAIECIKLGLTDYNETLKQMEKYRKEGFPEKFGLSENNVILRKHHSEKVIKLMNDWWQELNTHTHRDQLSLAYVLWKNGEKFNFMDESARGGKMFRVKLHKKDRKSGLIGYILNKKNDHIMNYPNGMLSYLNRLLRKIVDK